MVADSPAHARPHARVTPAIAVAVLVVLGALLRVVRLSALGDFDFDEVAAVWYARAEPGDILAAIARAPFEHPPLYYLVLHYWTRWFGESEVIARLLSVPIGLLLIPVTYRLARCYASAWTAVLAAAVVTASPLLIFYSREVRMYAPAALFATLALWLFERALRRGRPQDWLWLSLSLAAGIYFDFTVAIALVAMNARVLFLLRSAGRRALAFVAAELVAAAVVVPWLVLATGLRESLPALGTGAVDGDGLRAALGSAWQDLFAGSAETRGGRAPLLVSAVLGALAVAGLAASVRIRRAGLLWAYLGAALAFLVLLLAFDKPYQARYVLPAVPAVAVFVGLAITWIPAGRMRTAAGLVAAAIVLAGPLYAARAYYTHYQRGDYRSITTTIESLARPRRPGRDEGKFRDAVVLAGPWQGWYWRHYFPNFLDKVDVWFLPEQVPPAVTAQEVEASLGRAQDSHRRLWVVLAGLEQADPNHLTERWLTTHAWQARSEVYRNGVLQLYLTNVLDLVDRQGRLDIAGDFALELLQYTGYRDDQGPREAGDGVRFTLFLRAQRPVAYDLRVRVWLRGPGGVVYAKDAFVQDDGLRRTSQWLPNEEHVLRTAIWIPAEATPGVYEAYVAFIAPDGSGLPVVGHLAGFRYPWVNALWIGPVRIDPPSVPLPNEAELRSRLGGPIR